jgi:uncharacterized Fe-S cluster-containing radical SAM superfamily protein
MKSDKAKTGTREWSDVSRNIQTGCEHGCLYCYAKTNALRWGTTTVDGWTTPRMQAKRKISKVDGVIMFPTTHDITMNNVGYCAEFIASNLEVGNKMLVVSKMDYKVAKWLISNGLITRGNLEFRITIGSADSVVLEQWEPFAPNYYSRYDALCLLATSGFRTSVSMEPMLDSDPEAVMSLVAPFVHRECGIWIGRMNNPIHRVTANTGRDKVAIAMAADLAALWPDAEISALYHRHKDNPLIHWKDSIKRVVSIS